MKNKFNVEKTTKEIVSVFSHGNGENVCRSSENKYHP